MNDEILIVHLQRLGKSIFANENGENVQITMQYLEKLKNNLKNKKLHMRIVTNGLSIAQIQKVIGYLARTPSFVANCSNEGEIKQYVIEF